MHLQNKKKKKNNLCQKYEINGRVDFAEERIREFEIIAVEIVHNGTHDKQFTK